MGSGHRHQDLSAERGGIVVAWWWHGDAVVVVDAQKRPDTVPSISTPPPPTVQFGFCHPLCTWFCGGRGRPKTQICLTTTQL